MTLSQQLQAARVANDCTTAQTLAAQAHSNDIFRTLIYAVSEKQHDFTVRLYPYLSEQHQGDVLCLAVETRNNALVRLLLPHADPLFNNSAALQMASATQNQEIFDVLYPLSQPVKALKDMKKYSRAFEYKMLEDALEQHKIHQKLSKSVTKLVGKRPAARKI